MALIRSGLKPAGNIYKNLGTVSTNTINVSSQLSNYGDLTADNFLVNIESCYLEGAMQAAVGAAWNTPPITKTYNNATGELSVTFFSSYTRDIHMTVYYIA